MGLYDGYLYSRDGKIIPVDDTHHEFITKNPRYIFSPKEIEYLCNTYKVSSLKDLSDTEEFQFEDGPIYNHFLKSVLKKGWLKIRNNQPSHTTYIVCYNYKRDYDTIMNFIEDCPELAENTLHIEAFGDDDYLTTEKRDVAKDLFKMFEARVFPHSSGFGLSLNNDYEPSMINKTEYYPFTIEDDDEKYYFDKHGNSVKHIWNAICFGTKEEALDFGNKYLIFGELDVEEVSKTEQVLDESILSEKQMRVNESYYAAVVYNLKRDWETYYISDEGVCVDFLDRAKVFRDEDEAADWAEEYRPYGFGAYCYKITESIDDFPKNTRAMYRFAKRRHDDTKAIRKVSKEPYWVHPEGVAKIVMEHGGSDVEIKAAFAHDVLEDTGESYEDMEEKFGEKVASIVKEVTNDKFEIARIGKERYISEELCRLSPEALTVKLADMLYNMKDSPTETNYERMRRNIAFLMMNRQLDGIHLALAEEIMEV